MISLLAQNPILFVILAACLVIALSIHEFAHAWAADKLGDPTPRYQGRITLNPLAHLDPIGTLLLVLMGFGWGRPVMFNPGNLENPRRDTALIALAGPLSNVVMAIAASLVLRGFDGSLPQLVEPLLFLFMQLNINLAVFNMIPVHPLDGGKILVGILPRQWAYEVEDILSRYGTLFLLFLLIPLNGRSALTLILNPTVSFVMSWLVP